MTEPHSQDCYSRVPAALRLDTHRIGGRWQPSADAARFAVMDPATGATIADVADGSALEATQAADAASAALPGWRATPARERARVLRRWHAAIVEHTDALAALISAEQGKPLAEAAGEVAYGASYVAWFAEEALRIQGDILAAAGPGQRMWVQKHPVGVVAAITPWNFPLAMIARKIAPALAAGCTVIAKPAEDTPLTALALAELAAQSGLPAGVLNIVAASRERAPAVVDAWLVDGRVRKLTFTGSTAVGKHLARASADTLKKVSLELGGNAPFIVFEDADLDAAVTGLMAAKFRNGGQTCVCPNRVYVHDAVHDTFVERLSAAVGGLTVGPAWEPDVRIGPMINARALEKIGQHLADAVAQGARLVTGGMRVRETDGPHYVTPAVLTGATRAMRLSCEETFGPVVPVFRFHDEAEVIRAANDTPYGLAAYFYSRDARRIARVAPQLETGMVGINEGAIASEVAPFGGVKESGYGREGSRYGLDDYLHTQYLCEGQLG